MKLPFSEQLQTLAYPPHPSAGINKFSITHIDVHELHVQCNTM